MVETVDSYAFFFFFPNTKKSLALRLSLINYVKSWVNNVELINDCKLSISARRISAKGENFWIGFSSSKVFYFYIASEKENLIEQVNTLANEFIKKISESNFPEVKSETDLLSSIDFLLPKEENLFSKLIQDQILNKIICTSEIAVPTKIELFCDDKKTNQRTIFRLSKEKEQEMLEIASINKYENKLPLDIVKSSFKSVKQRENSFVEKIGGKKIVGEKEKA